MVGRKKDISHLSQEEQERIEQNRLRNKNSMRRARENPIYHVYDNSYAHFQGKLRTAQKNKDSEKVIELKQKREILRKWYEEKRLEYSGIDLTQVNQVKFYNFLKKDLDKYLENNLLIVTPAQQTPNNNLYPTQNTNLNELTGQYYDTNPYSTQNDPVFTTQVPQGDYITLSSVSPAQQTPNNNFPNNNLQTTDNNLYPTQSTQDTGCDLLDEVIVSITEVERRSGKLNFDFYDYTSGNNNNRSTS